MGGDHIVVSWHHIQHLLGLILDERDHGLHVLVLLRWLHRCHGDRTVVGMCRVTLSVDFITPQQAFIAREFSLLHYNPTQSSPRGLASTRQPSTAIAPQ